MNTRTIIAATTLAIFAGAAAADERQIDYTNMYSSTTRVEVMNRTQAYNAMHDGLASSKTEAYGSVQPLAQASSDTTRAEVMAEAVAFRNDNAPGSFIPTNEAYSGIPALGAE